MGQRLSRPFKSLSFGKSSKKKVLIIFEGLSDSGKTTALYKLKFGHPLQTTPTSFCNVETLQHKKHKLVVMDIGGGENLKPILRNHSLYYGNATGIVYFLNASHYDKVDEMREDIEKLLESQKLLGVPFLFIANTIKDRKTMPVDDLVDKLKLYEISNRYWHILPANASTGEGLSEGIDWLTKVLQSLAD